MRQKLKTIKKELDDQVRKMQADLVGTVSNEAKALVEKVRFVYNLYNSDGGWKSFLHENAVSIKHVNID